MGVTEKQTENQRKSLVEKLKENLFKKLLKKLKEKPMKDRADELIKKLKEHKKIVTGVIISLCVLLFAVYFGMAAYFMNHFYFGSQINGIDVSGKSVEKVNELMTAELKKYVLNLKGRGGKEEKIKADEIGLKYNSGGDFKGFKDNQNPFKWVFAAFSGEKHKMTDAISYDEKLLKERIDKLSCFNSSHIIEPKNAGFKYEKNKYVIVNEVLGNKVNKDILYKHVKEAVLKKETEIDLEAADCYVKPEYTSKSQKVVETRDLLNKYLSSKITYIFGQKEEVLDSFKIKEWISVDEKFIITLHEKKAKDYIEKLADQYNTVGRKRSFAASSGRIINVGGGDYGWAINKTKETEALVRAIKEGQNIRKKPAYSQSAFASGSSDIGKTYVEIDLTRQHLWFYKNGSLISQGDIVTGNVSRKNTTPPGIFKLKYKQRNAILRGQDYASPVSFWMPFNGGIGLHDASWRSKFGGNIYKANGSHGCINMPYYLAKAVFENIQPGTPVVCYN